MSLEVKEKKYFFKKCSNEMDEKKIHYNKFERYESFKLVTISFISMLASTLNLKQWHKHKKREERCIAQKIYSTIQMEMNIFLWWCATAKGISSSYFFHSSFYMILLFNIYFFSSLEYTYMPKNSFLLFHKYSKTLISLSYVNMNRKTLK